MTPNKQHLRKPVSPLEILRAIVVWACLAAGGAQSADAPADVAEPGSTVVVVYNSQMPESKEVADYYAQRRKVPATQVLGFSLPSTESMTREQFTKQLQMPLWQKLTGTGLFTLAQTTNAQQRRVASSPIRYLALCYGVPTKVLRDTNLVEAGAEQLQEEIRRNEGSVDSDLACLPLTEMNMRWSGPNVNPFFGATNGAMMNPRAGILMVTRLDGPSPAIAKGLVDKAMEAETNGLWGRAYIDGRGLTDGGYKLGDDWMRAAAAITRSLGFETEFDEKPATCSAGYPMSHIAFYAGWYDEHVSGPFTRPQVEFMPGAFAYHLHSFSAQVLRTTNQNWVGPLLAKGATITMGCVAEPYLVGTPDVAMFLSRLIHYKYSFGEAAYASQGSVSWQTIAVGDPLYRPFGRHPGLIQADLEARESKLAELCHLRLLNIQQAGGKEAEDLLPTLERLPLTRNSSVLTEKRADLLWKAKRLSEALNYYETALKLETTPQQRVRLLLTLAEKRTAYGPDRAGYAVYERFVREAPDYPEMLAIYQKMLPLAQKLDRKEDVARLEENIRKLSPPASPPAK